MNNKFPQTNKFILNIHVYLICHGGCVEYVLMWQKIEIARDSTYHLKNKTTIFDFLLTELSYMEETMSQFWHPYQI